MLLRAVYDAAPSTKAPMRYHTYMLYLYSINWSLQKYKEARNTEIEISQGKQILLNKY